MLNLHEANENDLNGKEVSEIKGDREIEKMEIPLQVPILPMRDTVIYPFMVSPLFVARKNSIQLIDDVLIGNRFLGLVAQKDAEVENPTPDDIHRVGTVATVLKMLKFPDGSIRIPVQGLSRMEIKNMDAVEPYFKATIEPLEDQFEKSLELEALVKNVTIQFQKIVTLVPHLPEELQIAVMNISHPGKLSDLISSNLNLSMEEKQSILEMTDVKKRLEKLTVFITRELEVLEMGSKIQDQV